jgi:Protein of unknown function (DUF2812)
MKKTKIFFYMKNEEIWLNQQRGWKLVHTNGLRYTFEESSREYRYEYIYFNKSKKKLNDIKNQIIDPEIEYVCHSSTWALFRKEASKGDISVFADGHEKYKILMNKSRTTMLLGACYMCLGSSQLAISATGNRMFGISSVLFYFASMIFFLQAASVKKYALVYKDIKRA